MKSISANWKPAHAFATVLGLGLLTLTPGLFGQSAPANKAAKAAEKGGYQASQYAQPRKDPNWPPKGPVPRLPNGHPDLSGPWAPNAIRQNVDLLKTIQKDGGSIPFKPEAEKLYNERKASLSKEDPEARCMPPGVPRMSTTPYPFRLAQTPGIIFIVYEGGAHIWRQIFTDGRKHQEDPNPSWLGDSIGHWDGDTLVVDTTGFNGRSWLDESGLPTTDQLHVIERFHRIDKGHMDIENTVDDPGVYTKPWSFTTHPILLKGELMEYICQENNRDVQHLVGK